MKERVAKREQVSRTLDVPKKSKTQEVQQFMFPGAFRNQPLITNWFRNSASKPLVLFEQAAFPFHFKMEDVVIESGDHEYTATVEGLGEVGLLELYEDDGRFWINQIEVHEKARRRGIAKLLLNKAIADHDIIYASTQSADMDRDGDTRHLTDEGESLVDNCISSSMNIIKGLPGMITPEGSD